MKKSLLIGSFICLLIIILLIVFGKTLIWAPKLSISEDSWDFGKVKTGDTLTHTFIIKNTGATELTLNAVPSCQRCIYPRLEKNSIPPQGATKLDVEFYAKGEGPDEAYVMIESNDPKQRVWKVTVKAMIVR